jgi:hypothetical protein
MFFKNSGYEDQGRVENWELGQKRLSTLMKANLDTKKATKPNVPKNVCLLSTKCKEMSCLTALVRWKQENSFRFPLQLCLCRYDSVAAETSCLFVCLCVFTKTADLQNQYPTLGHIVHAIKGWYFVLGGGGRIQVSAGKLDT